MAYSWHIFGILWHIYGISWHIYGISWHIHGISLSQYGIFMAYYGISCHTIAYHGIFPGRIMGSQFSRRRELLLSSSRCCQSLFTLETRRGRIVWVPCFGQTSKQIQTQAKHHRRESRPQNKLWNFSTMICPFSHFKNSHCGCKTFDLYLLQTLFPFSQICCTKASRCGQEKSGCWEQMSCSGVQMFKSHACLGPKLWALLIDI